MVKGMFDNSLVFKTQKYLNAEKELKEQPIIKEILITFPNCIMTYKAKDKL